MIIHLYPINREQEITKNWLRENDYREPTEQDFPTYLVGKLEKIKGPYLEDVHFAWKNNFYNYAKIKTHTKVPKNRPKSY